MNKDKALKVLMFGLVTLFVSIIGLSILPLFLSKTFIVFWGIFFFSGIGTISLICFIILIKVKDNRKYALLGGLYPTAVLLFTILLNINGLNGLQK